MPLRNRVAPTGEIVADPARGLFMGNRGGRIHDPEARSLLGRRWASRRWIICLTQFRGRRREVWGRSYTELFFLDEVTALAAGHRPCFECRRAAANAFGAALAAGNGLAADLPADALDRRLHVERTHAGGRTAVPLDGLPDGAMIALGESSFAVRGGRILPWTHSGYGAPLPAPGSGEARLLTPPSTVAALAAGYRPVWHPSAG